MVEHTGLRENSSIILERDKVPKDFTETRKDVSLGLILKSMSGNVHYVW